MPTTTSVEYREYLRSSAWQLRRAQYERFHEPVREAYGSTERVQFHHKSSDRLGRENDADLGGPATDATSSWSSWSRPGCWSAGNS